MPSPRAFTLALGLFAAAVSANGAQLKVGVPTDAAGSSVLGAIGSPISPATSGSSASAPLDAPTLSPTLVAPAASLSLPPSSLSGPAPVQAAAENDPINGQPHKAALTWAETRDERAAPHASALPVGPQRVRSLTQLGVSKALIERLESFLSAGRPADQNGDDSSRAASFISEATSSRVLTPQKKILLILAVSLRRAKSGPNAEDAAGVPQTLSFLDKNDDARALLLDFGSLYGFTAAQVKALIMATDFSVDPVRMRANEAAFENAAREAFSSAPDWAVAWGRQMSSLDAPISEAPPPARTPSVDLQDLASVLHDIRMIMGDQTPDERQIGAFIDDWRLKHNVLKGGPREASLRKALVPGLVKAESLVAAKLDPSLREHVTLMIRLAGDYGMTVIHAGDVIKKRGLLPYLEGLSPKHLEGVIGQALSNDEVEATVANYPKNEQGELMRRIAVEMVAKSGKSIEEVTRKGVFLYANFSGRTFRDGLASRDPDINGYTTSFYITRENGKWLISGSRQNSQDQPLQDSVYIGGFKTWLKAGGIALSGIH